MITEIVEVQLKPDSIEKFIAGVEASKSIFERSPGFIGLELHHVIENPSAVFLLIKWKSLEHHTEMFRTSPDFGLWRANVGEFCNYSPPLGKCTGCSTASIGSEVSDPFGDGGEVFVDGIDIEGLGIEVVLVDPLEAFVVFGVCGIRKDLH
jgi:heme-degrading monooxygenase HmoA